MKQLWRKKMQSGTKLFALLLCTAVGGYGVATAPESDQNALKQELSKNKQMLEQWDLTDRCESEGISGLKKDSSQSEDISGLKKDTVLPREAEAPDPIQSTGSEPEIQTAEHHAAQDSPAADPKEASSGAASTPCITTDPSICVIGDSVFLGAAPSYKKLVPHAVIDAKISRQVCHGLEIAKKLAKQGKLGNTVLISLGTNGKFNEATGQAIIDYLGKDRTVYWINAYGKNLEWQKEVNQTIRTLAAKNETVHVIDWAKEARKHPGWFYQDGMHLNTKGQSGFAKFILEKTR